MNRLQRLEQIAHDWRSASLPFVPSVVLRGDGDPRDAEAERLLEEAEAGRLTIGTIIRVIRTPTP